MTTTPPSHRPPSERDPAGNTLETVLEQLGLAQYLPCFIENDIDDEMLPELTADDLKEIGIGSLGHRKKLLAAFGAASGSVPAPSATPPVRAERREVTALFADITGYTRLSRELETEDLHAILQEFYKTFDDIVRHMGGTVDRHIGDCVLAVFGAPVSFGNDAERALRAAIEMHRAMEGLSRRVGRELSVHIGAAAGNVLFSRAGYGERAELDFTLTGDTVNFASRLADRAKAGQTLIDVTLARGLSHRIQTEGPTVLEVKGFDAPVEAYRLLAFLDDSAQSRAPMVGRDKEFAILRDALETTRQTGSGAALAIIGEAGMGKSRLTQEALSFARETGHQTHKAQILDFGLEKQQGPLSSLAASLCGFDKAPSGEAIDSHVGRAVADGSFDETGGIFLTLLLGGPPSRAASAIIDGMSDAARAEAERETLLQLLRQAAAQAPRLIVLEDLHWADRDLLNYTALIAQMTQGLPVTLLLTTRPEGTDKLTEPFAAARSGQKITLAPLRSEDALTLAVSAQQPSQDVIRACVARAQGNPLFLEQLLRHARDADVSTIPGSIQSLVQARIDRQAPADRAILEAAAVLGQRFALPAAMKMTGIAGYDEQALIDAKLIKRENGWVQFEHALIRDAILATILRDDLRALHLAAAEWYEHEDEALHAEHLAAAQDPRAAAAFLVAAQSARRAYRNEAALALADRGLEQPASAGERGPLLCLRGEMLRETGDSEASVLAFQEADDIAETDAARCRARLGIVAAMRIQDRIDEAYALLDEIEAVAAPAALYQELSEVHYFRGAFHFPRGNLDGCLQEHGKALDYARRADLPWHQAQALSGLGDAHYASGRMITGHSVIETCLALCEEHGFGAIESSNRFMLATVLIYMNETERALTEALASAELAAKIGNARPEIVSRLTAGWVLISMARTAEARDQIETALSVAARIGAGRFEPFLEESLARVQLQEGDCAGAARTALGALEKVRAMGLQTFIGPWVMATVALTTSDADTRAAMIAEGLALLDAGCVGHNYFRFYLYGMDALLAVDDMEGACALADRLEAYTAKEPLPWSDLYIARTRLIAGTARGEDRSTALQRLKAQAQGAHLLSAIPAIDRQLELI